MLFLLWHMYLAGNDTSIAELTPEFGLGRHAFQHSPSPSPFSYLVAFNLSWQYFLWWFFSFPPPPLFSPSSVLSLLISIIPNFFSPACGCHCLTQRVGVYCDVWRKQRFAAIILNEIMLSLAWMKETHSISYFGCWGISPFLIKLYHNKEIGQYPPFTQL